MTTKLKVRLEQEVPVSPEELRREKAMTKTFSAHHPNLRLVWDASTLDAFMRDPLSYYWKYVLGYRSRDPSIDLLWGSGWDNCIGYYHKVRHAMADRKQALQSVIWYAIQYAEECELDLVAAESGHKARKKNLSTLIRSIVWYDDEHGDYDMYEPMLSENTVVAQPLGIFTPSEEEYVMVGNYDQVVRERETGKTLVVERKSTATTISPQYWLRYDPSVQLNTYDWLANRAGGDNLGVFIEACQTAVGFTRFATHTVYRTPQQRSHWERTMRFWIRFAERIALSDEWSAAINLATQTWESTTRNIQRRSPAVWEGLLKTQLERKRVWNPLEIRKHATAQAHPPGDRDSGLI